MNTRIGKRAASSSQETDEAPSRSILTGLREAVAWSKGHTVGARVTKVDVPVTDVLAMRRRMRLSQQEFAGRFGFSPASVRNWEQGRRRPEGPARILLAVIDRHPEIVEEILSAHE